MNEAQGGANRDELSAGRVQPGPSPRAEAAAPRDIDADLEEVAGWAPHRPGMTTTIIFAGLLLIGAVAVLYSWGLPPFTRTVQSTNNAYVRGPATVIAPQVAGYVTEVLVQDFQRVEAGDPLIRIDERMYAQRVELARADLEAANANLRNAEQSERSSAAGVSGKRAAAASAMALLDRARADMQRVDELVKLGSLSQRERDQTLATLRQAEAAVAEAEADVTIAEEEVRTVSVNRGALSAAVESARAALRLAEIEQANTIIRAPASGQISEIGVRRGQYVPAGAQLMFVVPPQVWIVANFKENQVSHMVPGQPARIRVEALDRAELLGRVQHLAPAAGSEFHVIRPDTAPGIVQVDQRIPVRIQLNSGQDLVKRLRPGMSVRAEVDTSVRPTADTQRRD